MPDSHELRTARLVLRRWRPDDLPLFAELNADPRVMEKLGMTRSASDDFDHPFIDEGHPLRQHVLYRIRK